MRHVIGSLALIWASVLIIGYLPCTPMTVGLWLSVMLVICAGTWGRS